MTAGHGMVTWFRSAAHGRRIVLDEGEKQGKFGTDGDERARAFLQVEYSTLRGELMKRVEFRQRLLEITLVSAAAILTINLTGAEFSRVLLAHPILVMFLAFVWLHHGLRLRILATYIKTEIEPKFRWRHAGGEGAAGYETWLASHPDSKEKRLGSLAGIFVFIGVQVLLFWLGWVGVTAGSQLQAVDTILIIVGGFAVLVTAGFLLGYRR